ncbi:MAG: sulfur transferase domain-containing protein, partial [Bacteroidota bacterium]
MKIPTLIFSFFLLGLTGMVAQESEATKIESKRFKRLYQINSSLFRSEQPSKKGFKELEQMGVKTILNLRRVKDDKRKARDTQLQLKHIRLKTAEITEAQVVAIIKEIQASEKPVLVHCW